MTRCLSAFIINWLQASVKTMLTVVFSIMLNWQRQMPKRQAMAKKWHVCANIQHNCVFEIIFLKGIIQWWVQECSMDFPIKENTPPKSQTKWISNILPCTAKIISWWCSDDNSYLTVSKNFGKLQCKLHNGTPGVLFFLPFQMHLQVVKLIN